MTICNIFWLFIKIYILFEIKDKRIKDENSSKQRKKLIGKV